jgi:phage terminase large subunit-like protein
VSITPAPPRHHTRRSSRPSRGYQVAVLAEAKGRPLLPWQRDAVDVALEIDPETGHYWYSIVVVTVQRQAGKTKLIGDTADHRCLSIPRGRVWFTQQTGNDAATWMREEHHASLEDAAGLFGEKSSPKCRYEISKRAGAVGVRWKGIGSTFYAFPPKEDAMHSKQSDLTVVDEAWAHDAAKAAELRQAIRPTMATRRGAQLWIVSAAGHDGSEMLAEYVAMGLLALDDPNSRVCFIDYGIPDDADPEDLETILAWHPAYGFTQTRESFLAARQDFANDPAGWARAYGTRGTKTRSSLWPDHVWAECGAGRPEIPDLAGVAFDLTPRGDEGSLAVSWRDEADRPWVELLAAGPLERDFPDLVAKVARRRTGALVDKASRDRGARALVQYDPRSTTNLEVVDALARHHDDVEARAVTTAQLSQGWGVLTRAVFAREFRHSNQADLTDATQAATQAPSGDGGNVPVRKTSSGSIAPLVAGTVALGVYDRRPRERRKPRVVGTRRAA